MARPKNKEELLILSQRNFQKLFDFIDSLSEEQQLFEFTSNTLNRNIADVLFHVHEWHLMMLSWYLVGMKGQKPHMPAEGFTWKTMPELNKKIWKQNRDRNLEESKIAIKKSYNSLQELIKKHANEELFEKKRYPWTGSTSLGAYLISATSSHYHWALMLIKKGVKK